MEKRAKNGILVTSIITLALVALLSVFVFVVPFEKVSVTSHYINYGFACFVFIAQGVIFAITMFGEKNAQQRVMGLPIIHSGFVALGLQILASFIFFLTNAFVSLAPWIVILVEAIIIAYMVICVAKGFFFKSHVETFQEVKKKTEFMDEFRARLQATCSTNRIESISPLLEDLYDCARASDPVSNEKTLESETELLSLLQELKIAIRNGNETESRELIIQMKSTLLERNALCKIGK